MVTDRQDLDGQLFGVFASAGELLGESPKQANSRQVERPSYESTVRWNHFTTIQKFGLDEGKIGSLC